MGINANTTAGMNVKYAIESTAGTKPATTTEWTVIPGVKAIPAFGTDIPTAQSTPLSATKNHTYEKLLRDSGGAINLTVNDATTFRTAWDDMLDDYETAAAAGKALWVEYAYPEGSGLDSFYYPAEPAPYGFGGAEVDAILENEAAFLPIGDYEFAAPSADPTPGVGP